jgi:hypothetical protein
MCEANRVAEIAILGSDRGGQVWLFEFFKRYAGRSVPSLGAGTLERCVIHALGSTSVSATNGHMCSSTRTNTT